MLNLREALRTSRPAALVRSQAQTVRVRLYGATAATAWLDKVVIDKADLLDRNKLYKRYHRLYYRLPKEIRQHREYFAREQRSFGENAFTAMWYVLLQCFRPRRLLEIGVYRGQVISLWSALGRLFKLSVEIHAVSPFCAAGDSVSRYPEIDYLEDTVRNFEHFGLPLPQLHQGLSTDPDILKMLRSEAWDLAYIDGSHEFAVVKSDFEACTSAMGPGGLVVLDDASLYTGYTPPRWSFKGHEGPSRLAAQIDGSRFEEILAAGHNRVFRRK